MRRGEVSSVRHLRRLRPLALPLPLHDCGAAADLPGGRPRKPAGVSSAAPARTTSKPRLSVPSRAGATSVRATQGCRGAGAEMGRSLGLARRGAGEAGPPTVLRWVVPLRDNPEGLDSSQHPGAELCLPEVTSRRAVSLIWGGAYLERGWSEARGRVWGRPPSLPSPSLHDPFGRHRAPPPQPAVL